VNSKAPETDCFFLSYSRSDERVALRLAKDLRARGIAMWVDQLDIRPSEHWDRAIERAVASCKGLVVILSPRSVASDNVADEISFAIDSRKSVLPVMIERCNLPLRLTRMQVIDATDNYERALQQCFDELALRTGSERSNMVTNETPRGRLDAAGVAKAKQHLSAIVGPIAGRLVDKAEARASSIGELYSILALHIDDSAERSKFVALAAVPVTLRPPEAAMAEPKPGSSIDAAEIESMTRVMTHYIGPIASVVVKRESREAGSLDQLRHQLAGHIPDEGQRAEFLKIRK
jgi:hypothetical protein